MPKEVRYIQFSRDELHSALLQYQRSRGEKPPTDGIPIVQLSAGSGGVTAVLAITAAGGAKHSFEFNEQQLMGAVALFCKAKRIPLAVRSQKKLELSGKQLALVATINAEPGDPENKDSKISYADKELEKQFRTAKG